MSAPIPPNDALRLEELRRYDILDSAREGSLDRITRLASKMFDVPISVISLVDQKRQWFKSTVGLDATETPRDIAFCSYAILHDGVFLVPDAMEDERFAKNPLVTGDPSIRFYAGAPLITPNGHKLGTLCLIDRRPRELSDVQQQVLTDLAEMVMHELELRKARRTAENDAQQVRALLAVLPTPLVVVQGGTIVYANSGFIELTGKMPAAVRGQTFASLFIGETQPEETVNVERGLKSTDAAPIRVRTIATEMRWENAPATVVVLNSLSPWGEGQGEGK